MAPLSLPIQNVCIKEQAAVRAVQHLTPKSIWQQRRKANMMDFKAQKTTQFEIGLKHLHFLCTIDVLS